MGWFSIVPIVADVLQMQTPASGDTINIGQGVTALIVNNSGLLAVLNIVFPPSPVDGQRLVIACASIVTLMNMSAPSSSIKGALGTFVANGWARYIYSASAGAWFRTG